MVTRQLQVERRTEKVRRPKTDVLPLSHTEEHRCEQLALGCYEAFAPSSISTYDLLIIASPTFTRCATAPLQALVGRI